MFIHIQYKMPFSVLFLIFLTLSYLPLSLSYRDGARSESCYNMSVMHTNLMNITPSLHKRLLANFNRGYIMFSQSV